MNQENKNYFSNQNWLRLVACLLVFVFVLNAGGGCTAETRYKIKTVVFTGVPPLEGETADEQEAVSEDERRAAAQATRQKQHRQALRTTFWVHGPYGAGECDRCHNLTQSTTFQGDAVAIGGDPLTGGSAVFASRLAIPKEQLCVGCHSSHSATFASEHSLFIHEPSGTGACTTCHHPHQARRRFMLLQSDNRELCTGCHEPDGIHAANPQEDCLECHNAHMGTTASLLKDEDDELALLYHSDE